MTLDYDYLVVLFWDYNRHINASACLNLMKVSRDNTPAKFKV
jgi:hypothetical protein